MRKLKQRLCSLLLCAALAVSLCVPAAAVEDGAGETYIAWTWNGSKLEKSTPQIPADITEITAENVDSLALDETTGGWYIVRDNDVSKSYAIAVTGTVNLILADGCYLEVYGIRLKGNSSLSIYAQSDGENMGKLKVNCNGSTDAGIKVNSGSTVAINGGEVTAHGSGGAGIGGYYEETGGTITINGGEVTATSDSGAGIGGGRNGAGGTITIHGGEVTASSSKGNGISGGSGGVSITGGTVEATGSQSGIYAASDVTIRGGDVTANGSGIYSSGIYSNSSVTILGGTVEATGIQDGISASSTVTIHGGDVKATSSNANKGGYGIRSLGIVELTGGKVTASSSGDEKGYSNNCGIYSRNTITIRGGDVTANGSGRDGHGIYCNSGGVVVSGGKVNASGLGSLHSYGIASDGSSVTISGGEVTATGVDEGIYSFCGSVTISGGEVTAAGVNEGICSFNGSVTISGGTVTAEGAVGIKVYYNNEENKGSFSTGPDGNAFIAASSISDQSGKDQWRGVIFEGTENGKVYGSEITLTTDAEIPANRTLVIGERQTLIIGEGVTLTNNGEITGSGTIINNGTIKGNAIGGSVAVHSGKTEWNSDGSQHWHECAVEGCDQNHQFNKAAHTPGDWVIDKAATSTEAGQRHKACTVCGYVTATETIPATGGSTGGDSRPSGGGSGSSSAPTYKPDVSQPGQGGSAAAVSPSNPARGDTVTVTPKPDEGYEVDKITVTDRSGKKVEVKADPDGTFSFTQPAGRVTIEVTYKAAETPWNDPFADVDQGAWYYEAVRFVCERGLMNGYGDGRFAPEDPLSRAQLAQILFNKEGQPTGSGQSDFTDVSGGAWYSAAVCWAAEQGIVGGYGDGSFGPNAPITREQLAVMLWRYTGSPAAGGALDFADTEEISGFAQEAMAWAVEQGVMSGFGDGRLGPKGQATRAQTAQMLKNFVTSPGGNG